MVIDLSNWLNAATNLPEVWYQIIEEAMTNRNGEFAYKYSDNITREKDGELLYTKKYDIDLKITIDTQYEIDGEDLAKNLALSEEQYHKLEKTQEAIELLTDFFMNNDVEMDAIVEKLKVMKRLEIH